MGSIPIVKYENTHSEFTDLPILFISDWKEVTKELLDKNKLKIKVVTPESPDLSHNYTVDLFGSKGGLIQVIQALPAQKSWLQMPPGLVFDQLTAASTYGALEYVKNGGVVLKTSI